MCVNMSLSEYVFIIVKLSLKMAPFPFVFPLIRALVCVCGSMCVYVDCNTLVETGLYPQGKGTEKS